MEKMSDILGQAFEPIEVEEKPMQEKKEFGLIDPGVYDAVVTTAEFMPTKAGDGTRLSVSYSITQEGPFFNRRVWDNFNIKNKSDVAVRISMENLSKLCTATGHTLLDDIEVLINSPLLITVDVEPEKNGWPEKNKVIGYDKTEISQAMHDISAEATDEDIPF